jgi:DNA-binding NtrC family response regulator
VVIAEQEWMGVDDLGLAFAELLPAPGVTGCASALGSSTMTGGEAGTPTLEEAKSQFEAAVVRMALDRNGRNVTSTAQDLGVSRVTLYRLIDKHGLRTGTAQPAF